MTDAPNPDKPAEADRIAKVIARAGLASRREAERMILEGRVTVNGQKIDSPALDVMPSDRITVDGKKLEEPQETRLWVYYKPVGLVTSENDEKGRQTVFDALPRDLPRVMSVGRLDLNSEGLLLLTNDGELKRRLELPETGWLRRYRVRVNGQPNDLTFAPLRRGVTIEGEDFAPMEIKLDSQQGANAWLTVGIREGKNREIRRAMAHVGLQVNRLIRIGYGPFKLTGMEENEVREVKRRVLKDQLGGLLTGETEEKERPFRERGAEDDQRRPRGQRGERGERGDDRGPRKFGARRGDAGESFNRRDDRRGDDRGRDDRRRDDRPRDDKERRPFSRRDDGEGRPFTRRQDGERKDFAARSEEGAVRKPRHRRDGEQGKPRDDKRGFASRRDQDGKPAFDRRKDNSEGPRSRFSREDGPKRGNKPFGKRDGEGGASARHAGERRNGEDRPARQGFKSGPGGAAKGGRDDRGAKYGGPKSGGKPGFKRDGGADRPRSGKPGGGAANRPGGRTGAKGPRKPKS
ncbi:pseudouridine synthase [Paracoccus aerodenitrificans]|uniref:pseudouridine synthase n=1 Tax=Paracoccus aerodenitrificans TaxID=3017781 RepID=UPI0022F07F75|nr:pseudouridine synthase [Paracoccus aerodenitrificans]WBU62966.1 pseudouridine synthase [Paracoccus aerodenitrificans]